VQVSSSADRAIAATAARQHGVVTHSQLLAAGLKRGAIAHRLAEGRLHRVHRGVYLVGHSIPPPLARETAALFAVGKGSALSHRSAGHRLGLLPDWKGNVDVLMTGPNPRRLQGINVHRTRRIDHRDLTHRHGLPLTAPARTLLDLSEVVAERQIEQAMAEGLRARLVTEAEIEALLARSPGRRGAAVLRSLLASAHGPALTRNAGVVVEVDGYAFHSTRAAFERDRVRDAELQCAGLTVIRVTWRQLVEAPEAILVQLARTLARPHQRLSSGQWQ
jgi:Transcriptional regulator, AbiEi antitoxin/Protein of unknown function (DUF559)